MKVGRVLTLAVTCTDHICASNCDLNPIKVHSESDIILDMIASHMDSPYSAGVEHQHEGCA